MKNRNSFAILAFSAAFLLAACGGGASSSPASSSQPPASSSSAAPSVTKFTVTFDVDGGSSVPAQQVEAGAKANRPANPTKLGCDFDDWYRDPAKTMKFDFDMAITANTTVYANWIVNQPSSSEEPIDENTLYFRDVSWWNNMGGETSAKFDTDTENEYGEVMTYIAYDTVNKLRYTSISIPEGATQVTFYRVYFDQTAEDYAYGNNFTVTVDLSERGENNMYDISGAGASWVDGPISGVWGVYDPSDIPEESSSDSSGDTPTPSGDYYGPAGSTLVSWYIAGEGALFTGWSIATGLQLYSNPNSATDKGCILNVGFAVGDLFKVTDGTTWYGYEKVDPSDSPQNAGKTCFEGVSDGYGKQNFKCTVAGNYDVYVNKDGMFWIQAHAEK